MTSERQGKTGWWDALGKAAAGGIVTVLVGWATLVPEYEAKIALADHEARNEMRGQLQAVYATIENSATGKRLQLLDALQATLDPSSTTHQALQRWIEGERAKVAKTERQVKAQIAQKAREVEELQQSLGELQGQVEGLEQDALERDGTQKELNGLQTTLDSKQRRIDQLLKQLAKANEELAAKQDWVMPKCKPCRTKVGGSFKEALRKQAAAAKAVTR